MDRTESAARTHRRRPAAAPHPFSGRSGARAPRLRNARPMRDNEPDPFPCRRRPATRSAADGRAPARLVPLPSCGSPTPPAQRLSPPGQSIGVAHRIALFGQSGRKPGGVDRVVDDVQFRLRHAEQIVNLPAYQPRVADYGTQSRIGEQVRLGVQRVQMIGVKRKAQPAQRTHPAGALLQPDPMHAVAGAKHVAPGNALVALDQIGAMYGPRRSHTMRKSPVAPDVANVKRVADYRRKRAFARRPCARIQRQGHILPLERGERVGDKALGPAVRRVALPGDADFHLSVERARAAPRGRARPAAWSGSPRSCCRRSHRCRRADGVLVRSDNAVRRHPGTHSISPLGPNNATAGVPVAAAICIGAESTPTKALARAVNAASSERFNPPGKVDHSRRNASEQVVYQCLFDWVGSAGENDALAFLRQQVISSATRRTGQHLKCQREPGCN